MIHVSVVVPFFNSAETLGDCLGALDNQDISPDCREIIAVDDGSTDGGSDIVLASGARLLRQQNSGAPAARNSGIAAARGKWVAFTDADCVPSRGWLRTLLDTVEHPCGQVLGAAGPVYGLPSDTDAARFVDLSAGLDVDKHLSHPRYPFAPTANLMYRRSALLTVGGFDDRFFAYDACDLHTRLTRKIGGEFLVARAAVCLHRHRSSWRAYSRQQENYGKGLAQFYLRYRNEIRWNMFLELRAWARLGIQGLKAAFPAKPDLALMQRGVFTKELSQRKGFVRTYFNWKERRQW